MNSITKSCVNCNNSFEVLKSEVNRGNGRFCSRSCSAIFTNHEKMLRKSKNCECANCGIKFYRAPSKLAYSKSKLYFCRRKCKDEAQRIGGIAEIQPPHYNNGIHNYRTIAFRSYNKICSRCGMDDPVEILQVHHKDRDRNNNDIANLEILCPNCHAIRHLEIRSNTH